MADDHDQQRPSVFRDRSMLLNGIFFFVHLIVLIGGVTSVGLAFYLMANGVFGWVVMLLFALGFSNLTCAYMLHQEKKDEPPTPQTLRQYR